MTDLRVRRLLTVRQTAERLNVSAPTVYRRIQHGQIPAFRVGHDRGPIRVDEQELEEWLLSTARVNGFGSGETPAEGNALEPVSFSGSGVVTDSPQPDPRRLLKAREVASMLNCSPTRVRELVQRGELRSVRFGPDGWHRFSRQDVEELMGGTTNGH